MATVHLKTPNFPDCWETCGNCSTGYLEVVEVHVAPGDRVTRDQTVIVVESDKTLLDIPVERAGEVRELFVAVGTRLQEGDPILSMETPD